MVVCTCLFSLSLENVLAFSVPDLPYALPYTYNSTTYTQAVLVNVHEGTDCRLVYAEYFTTAATAEVYFLWNPYGSIYRMYWHEPMNDASKKVAFVATASGNNCIFGSTPNSIGIGNYWGLYPGYSIADDL